MNDRIPAAPTGVGTASIHLPTLLRAKPSHRDLPSHRDKPAPASDSGPFPLRAFPTLPPPAAEHEMNLPGGSGSRRGI